TNASQLIPATNRLAWYQKASIDAMAAHVDRICGLTTETQSTTDWAVLSWPATHQTSPPIEITEPATPPGRNNRSLTRAHVSPARQSMPGSSLARPFSPFANRTGPLSAPLAGWARKILLRNPESVPGHARAWGP